MIYFTGKNGQLGYELNKLFNSKKIPSKGFTREEWDISNNSSLDTILNENPQYLILSAAYTLVDKAETERELSEKINSKSVLEIAKRCKEKNIFIIFISTDFVFGGQNKSNINLFKPNDEKFPLNHYGKTKSEGENSLISSGVEFSIIRTSWLYSLKGNNFPKTILKLLNDPERKFLKIVEDQIGRPTYALRLAEFILKLIENKKNGKPINSIYHLSNEGIASWYDFAIEIKKLAIKYGLLNIDKPIIPIPSSDYPTKAVRPLFSVMDLSGSRELIDIPHWKEDLENLFKNWEDIN